MSGTIGTPGDWMQVSLNGITVHVHDAVQHPIARAVDDYTDGAGDDVEPAVGQCTISDASAPIRRQHPTALQPNRLINSQARDGHKVDTHAV